MTKTILTADDEPWFSAGMKEIIEEEGYHVVSVEDGTAAIDYLESGQPCDLVILDIMMPTGARLIDPAYGRRTCIKVGEYIRQNLKSHVPIIYLTVVADQSVHNRIIEIETLATDMPRIITKPVIPSELLNVINDCVGSPDA